MVTYILLGLGVIAAAVFIFAALKPLKPLACALLKLFASLCFVSVAVCAQAYARAETKLFVFVLTGAIFGLAGDFLLALKSVFSSAEKAFMGAGIGAFLIGHVFYLLYLAMLYPMGWIEYLLAAVCGIAFVAISKLLLKFDYDVLLFPAMIYSIVLLAFLFTALFAIISAVTVTTVLVLCGAILFVVSDVVLSFIFFYKTRRSDLLTAVNLTTYFPAQLLIALSLFFL